MDKTTPSHGAVLSTSEARQGNRSRVSLRVLLGSLLIALVVGVILVGGFWKATPPSMNATQVTTPPVEPAKSPPAAP